MPAIYFVLLSFQIHNKSVTGVELTFNTSLYAMMLYLNQHVLIFLMDVTSFHHTFLKEIIKLDSLMFPTIL